MQKHFSQQQSLMERQVAIIKFRFGKLITLDQINSLLLRGQRNTVELLRIK